MTNKLTKIVLEWILKILARKEPMFLRFNLTQEQYDRFYKTSTLAQPIIFQMYVDNELKESVFCYKVKRFKTIIDPYGNEIKI